MEKLNMANYAMAQMKEQSTELKKKIFQRLISKYT